MLQQPGEWFAGVFIVFEVHIYNLMDGNNFTKELKYDFIIIKLI